MTSSSNSNAPFFYRTNRKFCKSVLQTRLSLARCKWPSKSRLMRLLGFIPNIYLCTPSDQDNEPGQRERCFIVWVGVFLHVNVTLGTTNIFP